MFGDGSSLTYQEKKIHGPYTYFMDFATSIYSPILEASNNHLEFELRIMEHFLQLIERLSANIKDKNTLKNKYTGDFVLDLFYVLKTSGGTSELQSTEESGIQLQIQNFCSHTADQELQKLHQQLQGVQTVDSPHNVC